MKNAIDEIFNELKAAEEKHPGWQENIFEQIAIITEELGELAQAAHDHNNNEDSDMAGKIWDVLQIYIIPGNKAAAYKTLRQHFPFTTSYQKIKNEARQVAAMGLRFLLSLPDEEGSND